MAFEQKPNSGALFHNERKESDKHPDRTGSALIDGREYWVSGWVKDGSKGKWLSLSFTPKQQGTIRRSNSSRGREPGDDDEVF